MNWNAYGHPEAVNWQARGYFGYPGSAPLPAFDVGEHLPEPQQYPAWIEALNRAKCGDFALVPALLQMANGNTHPVIQRLCEDLIGDAGSSSCIDEIAERLGTTELDYEQVMGWCGVLTRRGKLADITVVLDAFEQIVEIDDAEIIPVKISECLETGYDLADHTHYESFQHYRDAVLKRCGELAGQFGSEQAMVVGGQQLSVAKLAERMLHRLREPYFPTQLRRIFESSTGIDCSSFYEAGHFKPMHAAALLEGFLESPACRQLEDGVRYFFGHRIP